MNMMYLKHGRQAPNSPNTPSPYIYIHLLPKRMWTIMYGNILSSHVYFHIKVVLGAWINMQQLLVINMTF